MKLNLIKQVRIDLTQLSKELKLKQFQDWYQVSWGDLKKLELSKFFPNSSDLIGWLIICFPEHKWHTWKFRHFPVSKNYWAIEENQRKFFHELEAKLNIKNLYEISTIDVCEEGGKEILTYYNNSLSECINSLFPEKKLQMWKFKQVKKGFWDSIYNQRSFMEELGEELGYKEWEEWYNIRGSDIIEYGGGTLLNRNGDSVIKTIISIYPEKEWKIWKFKHANVESSVWKDKVMQFIFIEDLAKRLNIKDLKDWYLVTSDLFIENGGSGLLKLFGNSRYHLLSSIYPNYPWKQWKFFSENSMKKQSSFWKDFENQKTFFVQLSKKLNIKNVNDWIYVKVSDITKHGGSSLLRYYNYSLLRALSTIYPSFSNSIIKKTRSLPKSTDSKMQLSLFHSLRNINLFQLFSKYHPSYFPSSYPILYSQDIEIFMDFVLKYEDKTIEVDVAIPFFKIAFEYQGEQHYSQYSIVGDNYLHVRQKLDSEKIQVCKKLGYLLIAIDHHQWDGSSVSLSKIISSHIQEWVVN